MKNETNMQRVINKICEVLNENDIQCQITPETNFISEYPVDSVVAIEILVAIEDEFDIVVDDDELSLELLATPKVLCDYIEKKIGKK